MPSSDSTSRIRGEGPDFEPMNTMIIICAPTELLYYISPTHILNILPNDFLSLSALIFYFFFCQLFSHLASFLSEPMMYLPLASKEGKKIAQAIMNSIFFLFLSLSLSFLPKMLQQHFNQTLSAVYTLKGQTHEMFIHCFTQIKPYWLMWFGIWFWYREG